MLHFLYVSFTSRGNSPTHPRLPIIVRVMHGYVFRVVANNADYNSNLCYNVSAGGALFSLRRSHGHVRRLKQVYTCYKFMAFLAVLCRCYRWVLPLSKWVEPKCRFNDLKGNKLQLNCKRLDQCSCTENVGREWWKRPITRALRWISTIRHTPQKRVLEFYTSLPLSRL